MPTLEKDVAKTKYKSPSHKLVRFFERSRDQWKEKYVDIKNKIKLLSNQVRYLKNKNSELKQQNKELKKALEDAFKKKP